MSHWMQVVRGLGACQLVLAAMVTIVPASPATAASSLVQSASACTYAGAGGWPPNFQMNPYGIIDIGSGTNRFNIACPIQTDPSTKKLKMTVFFKTYSSVPASWIATGTTTSTHLACYLYSQDRTSVDLITQHNALTITSGRAGTTVGSLVITLNQGHKINDLICEVPEPAVYLQVYITGFQVDQS